MVDDGRERLELDKLEVFRARLNKEQLEKLEFQCKQLRDNEHYKVKHEIEIADIIYHDRAKMHMSSDIRSVHAKAEREEKDYNLKESHLKVERDAQRAEEEARKAAVGRKDHFADKSIPRETVAREEVGERTIEDEFKRAAQEARDAAKGRRDHITRDSPSSADAKQPETGRQKERQEERGKEADIERKSQRPSVLDRMFGVEKESGDRQQGREQNGRDDDERGRERERGRSR